jgi:hypothetical protein
MGRFAVVAGLGLELVGRLPDGVDVDEVLPLLVAAGARLAVVAGAFCAEEAVPLELREVGRVAVPLGVITGGEVVIEGREEVLVARDLGEGHGALAGAAGLRIVERADAGFVFGAFGVGEAVGLAHAVAASVAEAAGRGVGAAAAEALDAGQAVGAVRVRGALTVGVDADAEALFARQTVGAGGALVAAARRIVAAEALERHGQEHRLQRLAVVVGVRDEVVVPRRFEPGGLDVVDLPEGVGARGTSDDAQPPLAVEVAAGVVVTDDAARGHLDVARLDDGLVGREPVLRVEVGARRTTDHGVDEVEELAEVRRAADGGCRR